MFRQLTEEEYDLEFLEARRERLANGITDDIPNEDFTDVASDIEESEEGAITRESFLKDLRKASHKIDKTKPSPKSS